MGAPHSLSDVFEPVRCFFLILLGWSDSIGAWIHNLAFGPGGSPAKTIIVVIAFFAIAYQVFNLFIASVFYYLFADVVPTQFLGRFMALFRVAGTCAGFVFNLAVLPHADTHLPWIFTIVALVYLVSFLLMCFNVKEGEYPPPEPVKNRSPFGFISVYVRECFSIPFFLVYFLVMALNNASTVCRSMFNLLFATKELHISLDQYGFVIALGSGITIPAVLFCRASGGQDSSDPCVHDRQCADYLYEHFRLFLGSQLRDFFGGCDCSGVCVHAADRQHTAAEHAPGAA